MAQQLKAMGRKEKLRKTKDKITRALLSLMKNNGGQPVSFKELAAETHSQDKARQKILDAVLNDMVGSGQIERNKKGLYVAKESSTSTIIGTIRMNARGFGYLVAEGLAEDLKIGERFCGQALNKDTVEVELFERGGRGKGSTQGRVLNIVKRDRTRFVGTLQKQRKLTFFIPDDPKIHVDFFIPEGKDMGAKHNEKVIADLSDWPDTAGSPFANIVEVLGQAGNHEVEMISILADHGLPHAFPKRVEEEAAGINPKLSATDLDGRRDLRDQNILTIDPYDAKDLDDAVSYRVLENGKHEIGIHIADVSHYVTPGSIIDKEAYRRATSVYLVDRVVPMLPEKLSNGVCSLSDDTDKLCFSAIFEMDDNGEVHKEWFGRTVIRNKAQLSYEQAQEVLDNKAGDYSYELLALNKFSQMLRKKRIGKGSLNISSTEVKFKLDEDNRPVDVIEKVMKPANHLIEDLMLLANRRVAEFINKKKGQAVRPFVYRVHDRPDPEKLRTLKVFVEKFGYKLKVGSGNPSEALNGLLKEIDGKEEAHIIRQLTIRSMAKAVYTTDNIGHFGLAFEHYTHFTSPIRRYPDLMVHRALAHYLADGKNLDLNKLEEGCKHSSEMERKAVEAERDSTKHMQALYLAEHLGESYEGVVSGLTRWGIYIELKGIMCEGLLALRDIPGDQYNFDERRFRVFGVRTGQEFNLGDSLQVTVHHVDLERKTVDLRLDEVD